MPLQATSGAASYDAFGGGVAVEPNYIESIFQTWLYNGTGAAQTITNGIDLAGEGGLVWTKGRNYDVSHGLVDTSRGVGKVLSSDTTGANLNYSQSVTGFTNSGYTIGSDSWFNWTTSETYVSWTFRKQPKFFDVVTWTGNNPGNTTPRAIPHNLGSTPGCIIVKRTNGTSSWQVYHRSLSTDNILLLNTTDAQQSDPGTFSSVNSTSFSVGYGPNIDGNTYVAYLFAHDAGGFGLTGTDNVISCGSFTAASNSATVNLGYEPQWILWKQSSGSGGPWYIYDTMRGWSYTATKSLKPNTSEAEGDDGGSSSVYFVPTATGFDVKSFVNNETFIYIAIRRGPMKVPTTGTSVFAPVAQSGGGTVTTNFPVDLALNALRSGDVTNTFAADRLRGGPQYLVTSNTAAEQSGGSYSFIKFDNNTGIFDGLWGAAPVAYWNFRRAPGFFDVVCYTGTGTFGSINHNLGVAPELIINKRRDAVRDWYVDRPNGNGFIGFLNLADAWIANWGAGSPTATATLFQKTQDTSGATYVSYLFASCPGVSKVTNFTGNGSSQTINCGFTSGARFVMIKATSTTGNWTVFDSARGISAGGDPALYLNSTAAEVTGIDAIDADSTGFIVNQEGTFNLNASGVQYLVLAIS